ncbi:disease resistance protein RGA2-like [Citrus clementina]|uniref:disease resistance protein RGA2-like n=1 Tax=Citrus clementina TaxID=85681 RepID=UPI000CED3038|nr:disease resistance protein RGA2-like [Citrus x clementina]
MVDAIVSSLLGQLSSVAADEVKQQVRLVTGVRQEVTKLTSNLRAIRAVLEDAEKRQMQRDNAVTFWLDQLKDASYDMEDVLEEWTTARLKLQIEGVDDDNALALAPHKKKVRSFFCAVSNWFGSFKQLSLRHDIAVKIREINGKLDGVASQKDTFKFVENVSNNVKKPERVRTTSLIDEGEVCGRVDEKNELLNKLCESSEQQQGLHVISLVGLGGIGKTTLAQLAYTNDDVKRNFEKVIWVCVSDTFEEIRVAKAIIEGLGMSASGLSEFESLVKQIQEYITGKKFFLVLDDVWDVDYKKWDPFFSCLKNGHHESKILITTRDRSVALQLGSIDIIPVKELAEEECWSLLERLAFFRRSVDDHEKLEPIGRKIAHKCKGLPLAAKVIGNLLRSKITVKEWQRILDSEMWKVQEIGQDLLAPLLLSYNDLPSNSMVKRCFSYCAVFPKDYEMDKEELIDLWMAQGYLNAEEDEEMEMIGEECFNILAARSFFQEFEKNDDDDDIRSCKMHDIVHDFAQFVSRKECLWVEMYDNKESVIKSSGVKVRHLGLNFQRGASFPTSFFEFDRLRSLLIYDRSYSNQVLNSKLACLRTLVIRQSFQYFYPISLDSNAIREIPENVGKLIHLKYLNLSKLAIEILPETLCELYNLQKLDIRECRYLRELPAGIGKLKNMRSLLNDKTYSLKYMPIGISRLTSLRTLEKFVVGGGVDGGSTCRLESLKNLQLLRECRVERLSNVSHVDEAERLQLYNKKNLLRLRLWFGGVVDGEGEEGRRKNIEKDKQLLEALRPPLNLEELGIVSYQGNIFPKWLTLLTNLRNLFLSSCVNCEHLPPLGKLPLEKLKLWKLKSVKRVGNEFLGIEENSEDDPSSSSSSSSVIAFPKLKSLEIWDMEELEEWNYRITRKENISIMPRLSFLKVVFCNKLKALPDYLLQTTALQELRIFSCDLLEELPILEDRRTTDIPRLSSLRISDCPKLKVLPDYLLRTTTLQELTIDECPLLENRYREGKGEDWHKISHIPHIEW